MRGWPEIGLHLRDFPRTLCPVTKRKRLISGCDNGGQVQSHLQHPKASFLPPLGPVQAGVDIIVDEELIRHDNRTYDVRVVRVVRRLRHKDDV